VKPTAGVIPGTYTYTIASVTEPHTVEVGLTNSYDITLTPASNGTVTGPGSAVYGSTATYVIAPSPGYRPATLADSGNPGASSASLISGSENTFLYTTTAIAGSRTITVTFSDSSPVPSFSDWKGIGPAGGTITVLAADPKNPNTVYAGTYNGVYRSGSGGKTWGTAGSGITDTVVTSLAVDPTDTRTLYAATSRGLFRSGDYGATWTSSGAGLPEGVAVVAINQADPSLLYAGFGGTALYRSTDRGRTWRSSGTGLPSTGGKTVITDLRSDPSGIIYAAAGGAFCKSVDNGATWMVVAGPLPGGLAFKRLRLAPSAGMLYSIVSDASKDLLYRSTDDGITWSPYGYGLPRGAGFRVLDLAIDARRPAKLYATTTGGIYGSDNGGLDWYPKNGGLPLPRAFHPLLVNSSLPSTILTAPDSGALYRSADGGFSWTPVTPGLWNSRITAIALSRDAAPVIYAGTADEGLFRSTDGLFWSPGSGLPAAAVTAVALAPEESTIYAGLSGNGLFRSTDGSSWNRISSLPAISPHGSLSYPRQASTSPPIPSTRPATEGPRGTSRHTHRRLSRLPASSPTPPIRRQSSWEAKPESTAASTAASPGARRGSGTPSFEP
jgi:photosystem II stability/assembly factor-like uncharacterized protein